MKKQPLLQLEYWFLGRPRNEKRLMFLLAAIGLPALFYLLAWLPLLTYSGNLSNRLSEAKQRYQQWGEQNEVFKKVSSDPRVLQWKREQELLERNTKNIKNNLSGEGNFLTEELLSLVFQEQNTIQLEKVQFGKSNQTLPFDYVVPLEVRALDLNLSGEYFDFVHYLERIENSWPMLKLNEVNYKVNDYPRANIQLGLAVLYAKKNK